MVVAPMVMTSPVVRRACSLTPKRCEPRNVPVFDGASRNVHTTSPVGRMVALTMQCVVSTLGSTVLMGVLALVPFTSRPIVFSPS